MLHRIAELRHSLNEGLNWSPVKFCLAKCFYQLERLTDARTSKEYLSLISKIQRLSSGLGTPVAGKFVKLLESLGSSKG